LATGIVGPQEQFDQREIAFTRSALGKLGDRVLLRRQSESVDPLQRTVFPTKQRPGLLSFMVEVVDGPVHPVKTEVSDPSAISLRIKEMAKFFGAVLVGITDLDQAYVYSHRGMSYDVGTPQFGQKIVLDHRYAICIGVEMDYERLKSSPSFIENADVGQAYSEVAQAVCQLASYIRELGYPARAHHVRREDVLHVPLAAKAGLGELGRCGFLLSEPFGPRLRLGTVTTTLPLSVDQPVDLGIQDLCDVCRKCATNCPSRSIPVGQKTVVRGVEKWPMDTDTCLKYWYSNPEQWDNCSICIKVCPWNKPNGWYHKSAVWAAIRSGPARRLLLWIDDLLYGKRPSYRVEWAGYVKER
jgi:reductive dehalogenase